LSRATIERFYAAFAALDADTMQRCYAPEASFDDEAFSLHGADQIGGMWRMLCTATKAKGMAHWKLQVSRITERSAHWDALPFFRHRPTCAEPHRRRVRVRQRRSHHTPPRPLRLLGVVAPGARPAGLAAGLDALAAQQGARHCGQESGEVHGQEPSTDCGLAELWLISG
jgi:hypothetical protein